MIFLRALLWLFAGLDWVITPTGFATSTWIAVYGILAVSPSPTSLTYLIPTSFAWCVHELLQEWEY